MSITDELREWANTFSDMWKDHEKALAIADRIDAEHERVCYDYQREFEDWKFVHDTDFVELPKDADGEYIRVGDVMGSRVDYLFDVKPFTVRALVLYEDGWEAADSRFGNRYEPDSLHHHHAPTVEDVLREFALKVAGEECMTMRTGVVEEYAEKLREVMAE